MFERIYQNSNNDYLPAIFSSIRWYNFCINLLMISVIIFGILAVIHDIAYFNEDFEKVDVLHEIPSVSNENKDSDMNNGDLSSKRPNQFLNELNGMILEFSDDSFHMFCEKFSNLFLKTDWSDSTNISSQFLTIVLKRIIIAKGKKMNLIHLQELSKLFLFKLKISKYTLIDCYSEIFVLGDSILSQELKNFFFSEYNRLRNITNRERTFAIQQVKQSITEALNTFKFALGMIVKIAG